MRPTRPKTNTPQIDLTSTQWLRHLYNIAYPDAKEPPVHQASCGIAASELVSHGCEQTKGMTTAPHLLPQGLLHLRTYDGVLYSEHDSKRVNSGTQNTIMYSCETMHSFSKSDEHRCHKASVALKKSPGLSIQLLRQTFFTRTSAKTSVWGPNNLDA